MIDKRTRSCLLALKLDRANLAQRHRRRGIDRSQQVLDVFRRRDWPESRRGGSNASMSFSVSVDHPARRR